MFKTLLFGLMALMITPAFGQDFRGSSWGDSMSEVRSTESAELLTATDSRLIYMGQVAGIQMAIFYKFVDGGLVEAGYVNEEQHTVERAYIEDYQKLKALLMEKYGEPYIDKRVWKNAMYRDDPANWGTAVAMGHLQYLVEWRTEDTKIVMELTGEDFEVEHGLLYSELASLQEREAQDKQETLNEL